MKRFVSLLLALCLLLSATPVFASAASVVESGTCGENVTWTLDDQGTLTISGEGAMTDYEESRSPWYTKDVVSVVIEPGITHIGDFAFGDLPDLESVSIANTVTSIGNSAFMFTGLRNVVLPDSVTTVGENAFYLCTDLETVVLSANLTEIPRSMFFACGNLKQIVIPKSVTSIGDNSFAICTSLENVLIQGQPTYLGSNVFVGCGSLSKIVLPEGITTLYISTFERCTGLKEITIPSTVTKINMAAFVECDALETVYYSGTLEQWDSISIDNKHNDPLLNANLVCKPAPVNPFEDVAEDAYYFQPVLWAVDNQITSGYKDGDFKPSKSCTRAEVVTFLWRAFGKPEPIATQSSLTDLDENAYYYKAVLWAAEQGITSGYKDGTFKPSKSCSRAEVITFLWRAFKQPDPTTQKNSFPDVSAGNYYFNSVLWAAENGITSGYKDGEFKPSKICTRAEVITFLWRSMED